MRVLVRERRCADAFAQSVEQVGSAPHPAPHPQAVPLLALARSLRPADPVCPSCTGPRPEFRTSLRSTLVEMAAAVPAPDLTRARGRHKEPRPSAPAGALRPALRWQRRMVAAGLCLTGLSGAFGGIAVLSDRSLPGDSLYGVKREIERLQLSLSWSEQSKGERYLDQATARLDETEALLAQARASRQAGSDDEITATLQAMRAATSDGSRLLIRVARRSRDHAAVRDLSAFVHDARGRLTALAPVQPATTNNALDLLDRIETEISSLGATVPSPAPGQNSPGVPTVPLIPLPPATDPPASNGNGGPAVAPGGPTPAIGGQQNGAGAPGAGNAPSGTSQPALPGTSGGGGGGTAQPSAGPSAAPDSCATVSTPQATGSTCLTSQSEPSAPPTGGPANAAAAGSAATSAPQ